MLSVSPFCFSTPSFVCCKDGADVTSTGSLDTGTGVRMICKKVKGERFYKNRYSSEWDEAGESAKIFTNFLSNSGKYLLSLKKVS